MPKIGEKIMLCGPMNKKASSKEFFEFEQSYTEMGYEIVNPFRIPVQQGWGYEDVVIYLISVLPTCDILNFLPDTFAPVYDRESDLLCFKWFDGTAEILYATALGINNRNTADKIPKQITLWSELLLGDGGHE